MSCRFCKDASLSLRAKLGRCKRCMVQLAVMNVILWPLWFVGFSDTPKSIESISLLFAAGASALLLSLHLVLMPFRKPLPETKKNRPEVGS
ncbi:DUF3624 domain-containing protein [Enterovibrio sp. ZSDZ35]|uniref:DUF3624 domain-containing protein n=1 Tax=Enterovibrio qingdaonensis TaxID=2899818 RepID=A0ABT5QM93_9GAMM|nr:DUF3624 domain-containing protein [Enterovibrio sp. ZSDZ35]MDD1782112.1 DUF3624 domain-containing protein [Enterovibrio sp. ZSDZ35]